MSGNALGFLTFSLGFEKIIIVSALDDAKLLQKDLRKLEIWEEAWGMKFNIEKFMIIKITLKHNPYITEYTLHGKKTKSCCKC